MTPLPYDVSRCAVTPDNRDCPLADQCLRRIDKGRAEYQAYTMFPGGPDCYGFWPDDAIFPETEGLT